MGQYRPLAAVKLVATAAPESTYAIPATGERLTEGGNTVGRGYNGKRTDAED